MAFRYINPGYVALLDSDSSATEVTSTTYSKSGVGFYLNDTSYSKGLTLENFSFESDFWANFDFYLGNNGADIYFYAPGGNRVGVQISNSPSWGTPRVTIYASYSSNGKSSLATANGVSAVQNDLGITIDSVNSAWLHVKYGAAGTGLIELSINGKKNWRYDNSAIIYTATNKKVVMYSYDVEGTFSNLIISDEYISPSEKVVALPIDTTETTMTAGTNGIYIADAVNQTLLQTPDVDALLTNYGATSQVTGITLIGNPAYKTAEGINSLIGLLKANGTITEHDSCSLDTVSSAVIMDCWSLSNTTISDLQNMQFGWKAGT